MVMGMVGASVLRGGGSSAAAFFFCCKTKSSRRRRHHLPQLLPSASYLTNSSYSSNVAVSYGCRHHHNHHRERKGLWECFCSTTAADSTSTSTTSVIKDDDDIAKNDEEKVDIMRIKEAANTLDIRVGKILKAWRHEEADSLYVEEVDVGDPQPRIICSGLVNYVPLHHFQDINVVVLANLKPRNMRGVKSYGMLMAASDEAHENVELLVPPEGSVPGERIWFGSPDEINNLPDAASPNQVQKKKIWELVQPHLRTDDSCTAALAMYTMRTSGGVVVCKSLKNARIS